MESLASRTNVASLRTGSATRPASHLNRGRAAPVAVRAQGANDDGNGADKTSSAVAGAWQKKNRNPEPRPGAATSRGTHRDGGWRAAILAAPSRRPAITPRLVARLAASLFSHPRAQSLRITT